MLDQQPLDIQKSLLPTRRILGLSPILIPPPPLQSPVILLFGKRCVDRFVAAPAIIHSWPSTAALETSLNILKGYFLSSNLAEKVLLLPVQEKLEMVVCLFNTSAGYIHELHVNHTLSEQKYRRLLGVIAVDGAAGKEWS